MQDVSADLLSPFSAHCLIAHSALTSIDHRLPQSHTVETTRLSTRVRLAMVSLSQQTTHAAQERACSLQQNTSFPESSIRCAHCCTFPTGRYRKHALGRNTHAACKCERRAEWTLTLCCLVLRMRALLYFVLMRPCSLLISVCVTCLTVYRSLALISPMILTSTCVLSTRA